MRDKSIGLRHGRGRLQKRLGQQSRVTVSAFKEDDQAYGHCFLAGAEESVETAARFIAVDRKYPPELTMLHSQIRRRKAVGSSSVAEVRPAVSGATARRLTGSRRGLLWVERLVLISRASVGLTSSDRRPALGLSGSTGQRISMRRIVRGVCPSGSRIAARAFRPGSSAPPMA